jgi:AraC family transcriptional regulator of adaptative response / DNA-3-methyladenine glycosylase II
VIEDPDRCYQAAHSKDARFDGVFFIGVTSTGIYCRPSCPARTPKRENVRFYATAASAQQAGFRACLRCRPDATPGSPEWNMRADVVARAMRLIRDGIVDREGVDGLARHLGYSVRQLNRVITAEVGTGPLAIARAQRGQAARILLESTALPVAHVAFAAGFSSVRQCNETVRQIFADTPRGLRARVTKAARRNRMEDRTGAGTQGVRLRLPARRPFSPESVLGFLGSRAVPGIEAVDGGTYGRSMRLPHGYAVVALTATDHGDDGPAFVDADLHLSDLRDLTTAVSRCRQLLDLDADPVAVLEALRPDPLIGPLVGAEPGRRVPGAVDGFELAVRAVIGQQVSVPGARTIAGRLVRLAGEAIPDPIGGITHLFPGRAHRAGREGSGGLRHAGQPSTRPDRPGRSDTLRHSDHRSGHRPRRAARRTGAVARDRTVDGGVRGHARPARPRCLHADRPRGQAGGAGARPAGRPGPSGRPDRRVASLAELRHGPPVGPAGRDTAGRDTAGRNTDY